MEFKSFIVKNNEDKTTNYTQYIAGIGIIACFAFAAFGMYTVSTIFFGAVVVIVIGIALAKRGNIQAYEISKEPFILTPTGIRIGQISFKISEISEIVFVVHSFSGMDYSDGGGTYKTSDGMDNYLRFTRNGLLENFRFYLNSKKHALDLCAVLREYYRAKVPVVEQDMFGRRTWLLKRLETKAEYEIFKTRHKIP